MPPTAESPEHAPLLFCPYCGEGFEGLSECPEHELTLLPIDRASTLRRAPPSRVTFFVDPRLGRGAPMLGAVLVLVGFVAPFVRARGLEVSALEMAIDGAYNLWLTVASALGVLGTLAWRRDRERLRGARLAVGVLALGGLLPLGYTLRRIHLVAGADAIDVSLGSGIWLMIAGLVLAWTGSFRLGGARPR